MPTAVDRSGETKILCRQIIANSFLLFVTPISIAIGARQGVPTARAKVATTTSPPTAASELIYFRIG
jgi:hypothetical protein